MYPVDSSKIQIRMLGRGKSFTQSQTKEEKTQLSRSRYTTCKTKMGRNSRGDSWFTRVRHLRSVTAPSMPESSRSFSDLPGEIRNLVYEYLLLTRKTKRAVPFKQLIRHNLQPAILRASKFTYREGKEILYHHNIFVHIITSFEGLEDNLKIAGISCLGTDEQRCAFRDYSLELAIRPRHMHQTQFLPRCRLFHLMVGAEDLEAICRLLWITPLITGYPQSFQARNVLRATGVQCPKAVILRLFESLRGLYRGFEPLVETVSENGVLINERRILPRTLSDLVRDTAELLEQGNAYLNTKDYLNSAVCFVQADKALESTVMFAHKLPKMMGQPLDRDECIGMIYTARWKAQFGMLKAWFAMRQMHLAMRYAKQCLILRYSEERYPNLEIPDAEVEHVTDIYYILNMQLSNFSSQIWEM